MTFLAEEVRVELLEAGQNGRRHATLQEVEHKEDECVAETGIL